MIENIVHVIGYNLSRRHQIWSHAPNPSIVRIFPSHFLHSIVRHLNGHWGHVTGYDTEACLNL